jgi:hypothetical protein
MLHLYCRGVMRAIPPLALLLGLLRPDGVLIGATFVALGALRRPRHYLPIVVCCASVGASYFVWRWRHFGLLLPLPLYVKAHSPWRFPGLEEALDWAVSSVLPLAMPFAAARYFFGALPSAARRTFGLGLVPFGMHAVALLFGVPTQNVSDRFEAPATLALLYVAVASVAARPRPSRGYGVWLGALLAAWVPTFSIAADAVANALEHWYVPTFARSVAKLATRETRLALTEAGNLAYWTDAPTLDLVGLNSPETARDPPTGRLLDRFAPDVIMLHPASTLDEGCFARGRPGKVIRVDWPLAPCVTDWARRFFRTDLGPYAEVRDMNIVVAPAATAAYLDGARDRYDVYAARFESRFHHYHLYAFRRASPAHDAYLRALEAAEADQERRPYISTGLAPRGRDSE